MGAKEFVSIVMVPRERFSLTRNAIEHIYAFTESPFELIVVDCGFPTVVKEKIAQGQADQPNLKVIQAGQVYPHEAKNIALKHLNAQSQWVCFVDSDVMVAPGWLEAMLEAARQTGARVVHPLYLFEHKQDVTVHMTEGIIKKMTKHGQPMIQMVMGQVGMRLTSLKNLVRKQSDFLEFHVFFVKRDILDAMGPFEATTLAEDVNWSLLLHERFPEEKIIFEPLSVVKYIAGPPFEAYDMPYFRFRWSKEAIEKSLGFLRAKWPQVNEAYWESKAQWAHFHSSRSSSFFQIIEWLKKKRYEAEQLLRRGVRKIVKCLSGEQTSK